MKKSNLIYFVLFFVLIADIFKNWLLSFYIIGGDWPFFFQEYINHFNLFPPIWNSIQGNGLGGQSLVYALDSYLYFTGWLFSVVLHIPWIFVYKIVWFGFFLILSIWSSISFFRTIFTKSPIWQQLLAAFLYTTNTYILLVVGGGQMGVGLGYAIAPLVLKYFITIIINGENRKIDIYYSAFTGVIFAIQILFDFRMAYITLAAASLYFLLNVRYLLVKKRFVFTIISFFVLPLSISLLLHAFWILPILFAKSNPISSLGSAYTSLSSVTYFSFATFENAVGWLHPYWPENIFGFIHFMKPEYLFLPILAFGSLFFVTNKNKGEKYFILYLALLCLLGMFLAKGANDPFGIWYLWMFGHIPGFVMFRDPMKWYLLIALSYSILISFSVYSIYETLNLKFKIQKLKLQFKIQKLIPSSFIIFFIIFWLFTIRQAALGQLSGTFARYEVPNEYAQLKNTLNNDKTFSRTLWLPKLQRFGYVDEMHPALEENTVFSVTNSADMIKKLKGKNAEKILSNLSVKYVIVPLDSEKEIFFKDRKYNAAERNMIISQLNTIDWLKHDASFKDLAVYTLKNPKDKFWIDGTRKLSWQAISDTAYDITISSGSAEKLIFNESYSSYWRANFENITLKHKKSGVFNTYIIPSSKKEITITLRYTLVPYYFIGRIISLITLISFFIFLFYFRKRNFCRNKNV